MKLSVFDQKGKEVKKIEVSQSLFAKDINKNIIAQYVYSYLSNQRQGNAHTKDRSEVAGTGRKPWKQKGTGRARVGTKQNPIWRGGGVAFGPTNLVNWKKKLNKKFKAAAFRNAMGALNKNKGMKVIDEIKVDPKKPLTKQALALKGALELGDKFLIVTGNLNKDLVSAFDNLKGGVVKNVADLNAYDILKNKTVLFEENAIQTLDKKYSK